MSQSTKATKTLEKDLRNLQRVPISDGNALIAIQDNGQLQAFVCKLPSNNEKNPVSEDDFYNAFQAITQQAQDYVLGVYRPKPLPYQVTWGYLWLVIKTLISQKR